MIQTARNTSDVINSIEEQTQLQAIADLARADAIQTFNYNVRNKIEAYFLTNTYTLDPELTWREIQQNFAEQFFASRTDKRNQFASIATANIANILTNPPKVKGFTNTLVLENEEEFRRILQESVLTTVESGNFFEVIGCEQGDIDTCTLGSFNVNLEFDKLSESDYAKLPSIRVENDATGRVIREPILPRTKFKIYIPVRIFKALAIARSIGDPQRGLTSDSAIAKFSGYGLGMCDENVCAPRTSISQSPSTIELTQNLCPGDSGPFSLRGGLRDNFALNPVPLSTPGAGFTAYSININNRQQTEQVLNGIIREEICENARSTSFAVVESDFKLLTKDCGSNVPINTVRASIESVSTATIKRTANSESAGPDYEMYCSKPSSLKIGITFREENEKFIVNKKNYEAFPNNGFNVEVSAEIQSETRTWQCNSDCETGVGFGDIAGGVDFLTEGNCKAFSCKSA